MNGANKMCTNENMLWCAMDTLVVSGFEDVDARTALGLYMSMDLTDPELDLRFWYGEMITRLVRDFGRSVRSSYHERQVDSGL